MRISATWRRAAGTTLCAGLTGCSAIIALFPFAPKWSPGKLELTVLNVGQGDSLFVVSPRGRTPLIDGGGAFGGFRGQEEHAGVDPGAEALSRTCGREDFRNLISWL
jgi:competence protein ComEC